MRKLILVLGVLLSLAGCERDAQVASRNLSKAADMFEVTRRIVFYNGITGEFMLELVGRCSIHDQGSQLEVTCKTGPERFVKHFLGLSDNVTYFAEQMEGIPVSVFHTRVVWKPQRLIPEMDLRVDLKDLSTDRH